MSNKQRLRRSFLETLREISVDRVMASSVRRSGNLLAAGEAQADIASARRILVAAVGKAAVPMVRAVLPLLPEGKAEVVLVAPESPAAIATRCKSFVGGHPYPNDRSRAAAAHLLARAGELDRSDLLLCLLSGGGSAICEAPLDPAVSLADLREFFSVLVTCGANIVDMNILRKHVSRIKGGRLAAAAWPARQLTLYVSDVPPDEPSTVASGPTMPDESTCEDAYSTAAKLNVLSRLPAPIRERFESRSLEETPKPGSAVFARSQWACLLDNSDALGVLESKLRALGWIVDRDLSVDDTPVEFAADALLDRLERLSAAHPQETVAVTTGGELASPVRGDGMGGRNQAFVLWVSRKLAARGLSAAVLSAGTDGIDGNSPAAGAIADERTILRAGELAMDPEDYERRSDSHTFFRRLGDLLLTGPTGNNVRDLRVLVAGPR